MQCHFQRHLSQRHLSALMCGRHIKLRKKSPACLFNSLATATANGRGIAVSWTVSKRIMRPVAISASERQCSRTKCIAKGNPPRRLGERSFKASGPAWGIRTNDCDASSTTSIKKQKGNTHDEKPNNSHHHRDDGNHRWLGGRVSPPPAGDGIQQQSAEQNGGEVSAD